LHAKYTLLAEGSRGQLGKELIAHYDLAAGATAQHYGLGIKELWQIDPAKHDRGWWCMVPAGRSASMAPPAVPSSITWRITRSRLA
jgi:flavin-dependent dehydrogenase